MAKATADFYKPRNMKNYAINGQRALVGNTVETRSAENEASIFMRNGERAITCSSVKNEIRQSSHLFLVMCCGSVNNLLRSTSTVVEMDHVNLRIDSCQYASSEKVMRSDRGNGCARSAFAENTGTLSK